MTADRPCTLDGTALPADRYVCRTCTGRLRALLTNIPALMVDLDIALTRQARFTPRVGSRSSGTPLPFAYAASEAGYVARQTLLVWTDWITAVRAHRVPETWAEVGDYLTRSTEWIARHPDGPQIVDELTAAIRNARHTIDRPADRAYAGICGALIETPVTVGDHIANAPVLCPEELYAHHDRPTVTCPRCGTLWPVQARRDAMLERLRGHVLTATDLARAVDGLGVPVTAERIRQWKRRGQLAPAVDAAGHPRADVKGRPLYLVGDVLDAVTGRTCAAAFAE